MRYAFLLSALIAFTLGISAQDIDLEPYYVRLDSTLEHRQFYRDAKIAKINAIKREARHAFTDEERFWINRRLYDEYSVYNADSALRYVDEILTIARHMDDKDRENEWKINRSFVLSAMGQLKDASDELSSIVPETLPKQFLSNYYAQKAYLYSHLGQLSGWHTERSDSYFDRSNAYEDSTYLTINADNPNYLYHKASSKFGHPDESTDVMAELAAAVDSAALDSRLDAMHAYALSRLYGDRGDVDSQVKYLILSGIADIRIDNRDIASLEELSTILLEQGDIDRAYNYVTYCKQQALAFPNYVRAASLAKTEALVHQLYVDRMKSAGQRLQATSTVLWIALALLVLLIVVVINRTRRLSHSQLDLRLANTRLNDNLRELSQAREQQQQTLDELRRANDKIGHINMALKEANYVKEECIGATFALCSTYIDKLDSFRKTVSRLIRANMWAELREEVASPAVSTDELKQFYKSFDTLFLNIYPDFVKDFNDLLRPDEQISVRPGELNTELRIYALVRLGITDSVKIASLLHCSPQTVYNNRLRVRNKSALPRDKFAEAVRSLGKFHN